MMDYWISFADTLSPNDGKGIQRQLLTSLGLSANPLTSLCLGPRWPQYVPAEKVRHCLLDTPDRPNILDKVLMQLRGGNTTVIQDDYREEQITFLHDNAAILQH